MLYLFSLMLPSAGMDGASSRLFEIVVSIFKVPPAGVHLDRSGSDDIANV